MNIDDILAAIEEDNNIGFCTNCDEEAEGVEPDARGYFWEACGQATIFGAKELLLMGAY